jgi:hypothetical protein
MSMIALLIGLIIEISSNGLSDYSLMNIIFMFSVCLVVSMFFLPNLFRKMNLPKFLKDNKERSNV